VYVYVWRFVDETKYIYVSECVCVSVCVCKHMYAYKKYVY